MQSMLVGGRNNQQRLRLESKCLDEDVLIGWGLCGWWGFYIPLLRLIESGSPNASQHGPGEDCARQFGPRRERLTC